MTTGDHPNYPGMPFPEAVIRQAIGEVLDALCQRTTQSNSFESEQFQKLLLHDGMNAAMPSLLRILPQDLAVVICDGITHSLIASLNLTARHGDVGKPQRKR